MSSNKTRNSFRADDFCKLRKMLKHANYKSSNILNENINNDFADHSSAVSYLIRGMHDGNRAADSISVQTNVR